MLDNFREWLSDNLRYILLGLAILAALLLLLFGFRFVKGLLTDSDKEPKKQTEQIEDSNDSDKSDEEESFDEEDENALKKNAYPEVTALIESFYTAWGQKDAAKMGELTDHFGKTDEAKVAGAAYIEEYQNVEVYTKKGLEENTFVVFASYDLKFKDVETAAPGLAELYVYQDENGNYLIHNDDSDAEVMECIEKTRQEEDVMELVSEVETRLNEAIASDGTLRAFEEQLGEQTNTALMADDGDMLTAKDDCNVRAEADGDSKLLGKLKAGEQVRKIENASEEWIKVEYEGEEAYIFWDLLQ